MLSDSMTDCTLTLNIHLYANGIQMSPSSVNDIAPIRSLVVHRGLSDVTADTSGGSGRHNPMNVRLRDA